MTVLSGMILGSVITSHRTETIEHTTTVVKPGPTVVQTSEVPSPPEPLPLVCSQAISQALQIVSHTTSFDKKVGDLKLLVDDLPIAAYHGIAAVNQVIAKINPLKIQLGNDANANLEIAARLGNLFDQCKEEQ